MTLPRFIPFSPNDITQMCQAHPQAGAISQEQLSKLEQLLSHIFLLETGKRVDELKVAYQPCDPDTDLINPFAGVEQASE